MAAFMQEAGVKATFFINTKRMVDGDQGPRDEHVYTSTSSFRNPDIIIQLILANQ
jgi:hypothetical protein